MVDLGDTVRTLVVMRHAKAEPHGPTDFERPLAARGHVDAAAAGAWLHARGVVPQAAIVSAALRTTETWQDVALSAGWEVEADHDRGLYAADTESALDLVRLLADDVTTAVVVGHNPTMGSLAATLDDGDGDVEATNELAMGSFPTSAVAVLTLSGPWRDLSAGGARLSGYHVGRG